MPRRGLYTGIRTGPLERAEVSVEGGLIVPSVGRAPIVDIGHSSVGLPTGSPVRCSQRTTTDTASTDQRVAGPTVTDPTDHDAAFGAG